MAKLHTTKSVKRARLMDPEARKKLMVRFGNRVKKRRLALGLTPLQFYERSGIDGSNLSKYERGEREPGLVVMVLIAGALGWEVSKLVDFRS